jgi:hypothetical protein
MIIRYPRREGPFESTKDMPENQEVIQEMTKVNPFFKKSDWMEQLQDWLHPEEAVIRKEEQKRLWEAERRAIEELRQQAIQQREREMKAQALVQSQRPEFVEQNLGQWIRQIEEDERARLESPTERCIRERRQEIQDHRRFLERDWRFQGIVEDVRRLSTVRSVKRCLGGFGPTYPRRNTRIRWHVRERSYWH